MAEFGEPLSDREQDVLEQVMQGASNKEIAQILDISPNTVKVHLRNIYTKLDVSSRTEASMVAVERGLIDSFSLNDSSTTLEDEKEDEEDLEKEQPTTAAVVPPNTIETEPANHPPTAVGQTNAVPLPAAIPAPQSPPLIPAARRPWWIWALLVIAIIIVSVGIWEYVRRSTQPTTEIILPAAEPFAPEQLSQENWFRSLQMPQPRADMASISIGVDLYQIGGLVDGQAADTVNVFTINTSIWRTAASKPTAVSDITAAELLEIYVPGGLTAANQPTDIVEAYSPTTDTWRAVQSLPKPIAGGLTLANDSAIFLFGGWDGNSYLNDAYIYDPISDAWGALAPMKHARAHAAGGLINGLFYVVGGFDGTNTLDVCEVYDPLADRWTDCKELTEARQDAGAAVVLNKLYVFGGQTDDEIYGELYDPTTDKWQIINTPELENGATIGWRNPAVTNVEARIFIQGGRLSENSSSAEVLIYAPRVYQTFIPAASSQSDASPQN
ncbi:MAG: hypothetical protein KDE51_14635 [Anaerolineales bacterium]|nr:hypothetical protein [Anaerolineales bacterium]